jgi:hypothetical protein
MFLGCTMSNENSLGGGALRDRIPPARLVQPGSLLCITDDARCRSAPRQPRPQSKCQASRARGTLAAGSRKDRRLALARSAAAEARILVAIQPLHDIARYIEKLPAILRQRAPHNN